MPVTAQSPSETNNFVCCLTIWILCRSSTLEIAPSTRVRSPGRTALTASRIARALSAPAGCTAAICTRVTRFEARGRFAVTMNEMRASAGETFYFEAPDRMRMELDFPGYLWVPPASGEEGRAP